MSSKLLSLSILSLLLAACDPGNNANNGNNGAQSVRETVTSASITLPKAIEIAMSAQPGALVEAELEVENTTPIYEVRLLDAGVLTKVHVHPDTGAVIRTELDDDSDSEDKLAADMLATAKLAPAALIAAAEAERPGSVAFELEVKDGAIEVEVTDATGLFEISISPQTGEVTRVDASDDDHKDDDDDLDDHKDDDHDDNDDD